MLNDGRYDRSVGHEVALVNAVGPTWQCAACWGMRCSSLPCWGVRCSSLPCWGVRCSSLPCWGVDCGYGLCCSVGGRASTGGACPSTAHHFEDLLPTRQRPPHLRHQAQAAATGGGTAGGGGHAGRCHRHTLPHPHPLPHTLGTPHPTPHPRDPAP